MQKFLTVFERKPDRLGKLALLPVCIGIVMLIAMWFIGRKQSVALGFPLDDSWIHMVYGRSLAAEGLLAYNPDVASTGCTSPLWAVCLAFVHVLFGWKSVEAVIVGVMALSCALFLACIFVATDLTARITEKTMTALAAGFLIALSTPIAMVAFSGMEILLCALLLVIFARDCVCLHWGRAGVWLALAGLTRPEAGFVALISLLVLFIAARISNENNYWVILRKLILPSVILGVIWVVYNLVVSGRPLPSTFYIKQSFTILDFPNRLHDAVSKFLGQAPPFWGWIGWFAFAGYFSRKLSLRMYFPLIAGVGFLFAVAMSTRLADPTAFYFLRYVLPCVPILIVALVIGADLISELIEARLKILPMAALIILGILGSMMTLKQVSYDLHNDTRNINEVQREMGEWIAQHTEDRSWIAATDAGAVRYFSNQPTVDLMGLNTPALYWDTAEFIREHPVVAMAIMPAWLSPVNSWQWKIYKDIETKNYTVSGFLGQARQIVGGCIGDPTQMVRIYFSGLRHVYLDCLPGRVNERSN